MSNLRTTIDSLANDFASSLLQALRGASLEELLSVTGGGAARSTNGRTARAKAAPAAAPAGASKKRTAKIVGGRLARRSKDDIAALADRIAKLVSSKGALRSEQIRDELGLDKKELPRALADGLDRGILKKKGEKRSTTYSAK